VRVVVTGATGNAGTSLLKVLSEDDRIDSVVGIARRTPGLQVPKTTWVEADVAAHDLMPHFRGADAVVHLAWLIQPSRDQRELRRVNVDGSRRVFRAVVEAGVPSLVYASSIGAYSPAPKSPRVDESWPTEGITTSFYSRHKAETERMLDSLESEHSQTRVVRLRPALIFKRESASGQRRLFAGPFLPNILMRRYFIPIVPHTPRLVFQAVHSYDIGDAYRQAIVRDVHGPFNVAAEPVLDSGELAELLHARPLPIPERFVSAAAALSWRLRLQPTPRGWVDMGLQSPIMDCTRAHVELDWSPRFTSKDAIADLLAGMWEGAGMDTPPLSPHTGGPLRLKELLTGIGGK
jgi:UDP-glucose 4-epimerase